MDLAMIEWYDVHCNMTPLDESWTQIPIGKQMIGLGSVPVWPDKNRQMSIKVDQIWFL